MRCPHCKKQVQLTAIESGSFDNQSYKIHVIAFHLGKNGKPCPGSGNRAIR